MVTMDNNGCTSSYEDVLKDLKNRVEILRNKCCTAQKTLENKVTNISRVDKDIGQTEFELSELRKKNSKLLELWKEREIDIEKLKWAQEKALVIYECNRRKYKLQSKTMNIIRQNYSNLTTCAFKTVRQETVKKIMNNEINNLVERKRQLENELMRLRELNNKNENRLVEARMRLMAAKTRGEAMLRLERKLRESEALKSKAVAKLNNLKISRFKYLQ